jgi:HupE / UreJ protein
LLVAPNLFAHDPSKSYLTINFDTNQAVGQWDIPLKDLQTVVPLDSDNDGFVTWEELNAHYKEVTNYALAHLKISGDAKPGTLHFTESEPIVEDFADGTYLELPFILENVCQPNVVEFDYQLFFETNHSHRGLLRLQHGDKTDSAVFDPEHAHQQFEINHPSPGKQFLVFLKEGISHIWTGYDHILFLLALLLPAVLHRQEKDWQGVPAFRPAFFNVLKIVTAFTLAHSLTLSLAALNIVRLPTRLTESAIAASVILAATNNIWPWIKGRGWVVAFIFGLIHGFGFANALSELGLTSSALILTLVGFNLGVELGQLAIVTAFLPFAYGFRNSWIYRRSILHFGSACIILIAATWLTERVFNFKVLPF